MVRCGPPRTACSPSHGTGVGKPRAAAHRDGLSDFSCMQVSITQLILRISPPAEYEFRIPVFHIHVPSYCAYGKLRAAGDSESRDLRGFRIIRVSYTAWVPSGFARPAAAGELCRRRSTCLSRWSRGGVVAELNHKKFSSAVQMTTSAWTKPSVGADAGPKLPALGTAGARGNAPPPASAKQCAPASPWRASSAHPSRRCSNPSNPRLMTQYRYSPSSTRLVLYYPGSTKRYGTRYRSTVENRTNCAHRQLNGILNCSTATPLRLGLALEGYLESLHQMLGFRYYPHSPGGLRWSLVECTKRL